MSRTQDPQAADRVVRALADRNWLVRFAGAICAGDLRLKSAYKPLAALATDPDANVRVAVRYALHQLGDKSLSNDLEPLSQNNDPHVRGNVAMVLGKLGEPTATRILRPMLTDTDFDVRQQAAEGLWRLGDEQGQKNLIAGSLSKYVDDQMFSILGLAATNDQRMKPYVMAKFANDHDKKQLVELQLVAARSLGMLGDDSGFGLALRSTTSSDPRRRVLAAWALGEIGRSDGQDALAKLLADPSQDVRLAAATALRMIGNRNRA
jgi:HEAT repeat protein